MQKIPPLLAILLLAAVLLTAGCTTTGPQPVATDENDPIIGEWVMNGYYIDETNARATIVTVFNADNTFVSTEYAWQENSGDAQYAAENFIGNYLGTWTKNSDGTYTITYKLKAFGADSATVSGTVLTDSEGNTYEKKTIPGRAVVDPIVGEWVMNGYYLDAGNLKACVIMQFNADNTFISEEYAYKENAGDTQFSLENFTGSYTGTWMKNSDDIYIIAYNDSLLGVEFATLKDNILTDEEGSTYTKKATT